MAFPDQRAPDRPGLVTRAEPDRADIIRAESAGVESSRAMSGERVLVVDDEPIVSEVVQRYLIREGYQVSVAGDGRSAGDFRRSKNSRGSSRRARRTPTARSRNSSAKGCSCHDPDRGRS